MLRWDDAESVAAMASLIIPLLLLDATLMGPKWQLPQALLAAPQDPPKSSSSSRSSGAGAAGSSGRAEDGAGVDLGKLEQVGWGPLALQLSLAVYQRASLVAPGALGRPPLQVEIPLVAARAASQEALRAFLISSTGGWLADRLREAGFDDIVQLPGPLAAPAGVPLQLLGSCLAAAALTLLLLPVAVVGAAEAQELSAAALLLETEAGRAAARAAERRASGARTGGSSGASSSSSSGGGGGSVAKGSRTAVAPLTQTEAALEALLAPAQGDAGISARSSSGGSGGGDDDDDDDDDDASDEDDGHVDPLVLEWRLQYEGERASRSVPARAAGWLSFLRAFGRSAAQGAGFVASGGNLAATLGAALALSGLQLACASANGRGRLGGNGGDGEGREAGGPPAA